MIEKSFRENSAIIWNSLVKNGVDPLQVLSDAGFETNIESLRLSVQIRYTSPIPTGTNLAQPPEKKLEDAKWAALKEVEAWLNKIINEQHAIALQAALVWLGYDYCRINKDKAEWDLPWWVLFFEAGLNEDDLIMLQDNSPINHNNAQERLLGCLDAYPQRTIQAVLFLSEIYEIAFSKSSNYNSPERLERFFSHHLPSWKAFTVNNTTLQKTIDWANNTYLHKSSGKKSQALQLLIKSLEFFLNGPKLQVAKLYLILRNWQKLTSSDEIFFSKYNKKHTINMAAREALDTKNLTGNLKIAEEIDRATSFEYSGISKRKSFYNKIDRLYTARIVPDDAKAKIKTFTLSQSELKTLDDICASQGLSKTAAIDECVGIAYRARTKKKKILNESLGPLFQRAKLPTKSFRVSAKAVRQINDVTATLNKLKATESKVVSMSATLGWAIMITAFHLSKEHQDPVLHSTASPATSIRERENFKENPNSGWKKAAESRAKKDEQEYRSTPLLMTKSQSNCTETTQKNLTTPDSQIEAHPIESHIKDS